MPLLESIGCKLALSVIQTVVTEVGSLLMKKPLQLWKADENFRELQATYLITEAKLGELDRLQIMKTTLEPWLQDLDRYCYDIEDIVDDLKLSLLNSEEGNKKPVKHPWRSHAIKSGKLKIPHQIGELQKKLKEIISLIETLSSAGVINSEQPRNGEMPRPSVPRRLSDNPPIVSGTIRDQDKKTIISNLTSQQSESCGASIIGIDGLGKTSLARTILDDASIREHLPLVLSACVSGHFQVADVVQKLVEDHSRRTNNPQPAESHNHPHNDLTLQGLLCKNKCLIILDDLWSVIVDDWDDFTRNYLKKCQGWKILTTTRNPKVAEVTQCTSFYLDRMTDEDCKKLIIHRANLSKFESESWSDDIKDIAKKCMGMPILANKLGLKLSKKKIGAERKDSIIKFKNAKLWDLQEFSEVFPSLNLNQPKLQPDLKRCFAYCSLFPPSHEFNKVDLNQSWEVEGFIQPQLTGSSNQGTNPPFEKLLSRSILQPLKPGDKRKPELYKMHELNHEFAHLLASTTFRRLGEGAPNLLPICRNLRHLSLACQNTDEPLLKEIEECKGLRTFLLLHHSNPKKRNICYNFFHKLHRLRLLDLSHTDFSGLSEPIFPSKHLRCLDLSYTSVEKLPKSITSLRALQILKLKGCSKLLQLPNDLNQLINLKHLHVDMKGLGCLPSNIGKLTKLEVLSSFCVGKVEGCKVVELSNMGCLKEIQIFGLENIKDKSEAQEAMVSKKPSLRILELQWDAAHDTAGDILEGLQPHNDLRDLIVRNYGGQNFPTWLISPSCQLVSIYLENCPNCSVLPSLAQLPFLKTLVLRKMLNVRSLDDQFCGHNERVYPCLEFLEFHRMEGLVSWTGLKAGDMPCLRDLKIVGCTMLENVTSFQHLTCLMSLEINNCPKLQSLPELPSSLTGDLGELVIIYSPLVAKRCEVVGADWPKIKDILYLEIDAIKIPTKSSSQPQNEKNGHRDPATLQTPNDEIQMVSQNGHPYPVTLKVPNSEIQMVQDPDNTEHISGSGTNGNQNIGSQRQHPSVEACRESKGKQKVDEGSSSKARDDYDSEEQTENQGTTTEDQLNSNLLQASPSTGNTTVQMPSNGNDLQGRRRPSKTRSSRGFLRRYLFGCISKGQ